MEKDIENLIEELTKVRPEMLNEEALKLFNTIMAILDERDKLIKENEIYRLTIGEPPLYESEIIQKSKIKEIRDKAEVMDYYTLPDVIEDLNKLLGDEK